LGISQASDARSNDTNPCTNADIPVSDPGIFAPAAPVGHHTMKRSYKQGVSSKDRSAATPSGGAAEAFDADGWDEVPAAFRSSRSRLTPHWEALFGPLRTGAVDDLVVVAQTGQSLDGRIATSTGHSHYINAAEGRAHLHRLRALVDAVVVGVSTVLSDDPQLTVRLVRGPCPARVVLDPKGRAPADARVFAADGARRLVVTAATDRSSLPAGVESVGLSLTNGRFAPVAILGALAERGLRRILIEGGPATISGFLAASCLDRLHVLVAPIILGAGPAGLQLPPITRVDEALRPQVRVHRIAEEVLFDCDLSARRIPVFRANK
jgi:diaminohydroxyphosphoribosylaminopyrimidine deaminase / 5-amino-6-(5-phosphoribosylamino)uracil reductase